MYVHLCPCAYLNQQPHRQDAVLAVVSTNRRYVQVCSFHRLCTILTFVQTVPYEGIWKRDIRHQSILSLGQQNRDVFLGDLRTSSSHVWGEHKQIFFTDMGRPKPDQTKHQSWREFQTCLRRAKIIF